MTNALRIGLLLLAAWLWPQRVSASTLFGIDYGSASSSTLYSLQKTTGVATAIGPTGSSLFDLTSDPRVATFTLFGINSTTTELDVINPVTGAVISAGAIDGLNGPLGSVAFNTLLGGLFATTIGQAGPGLDESDTLYSIGLTPDVDGNYTATPVGGTGTTNILALTFDTAGVLFGVSDSTHNLVSINTATGAATTVGAVVPQQVYALATDPDTGAVYAASTQSHALYTLDTGTGGTDFVGGYGQNVNINGLAFEAGPPAAVPEPGTAGLLGLGLVGLKLVRRRR